MVSGMNILLKEIFFFEGPFTYFSQVKVLDRRIDYKYMIFIVEFIFGFVYFSVILRKHGAKDYVDMKRKKLNESR